MLAVSFYLVATTSSSARAFAGTTPPTWHLRQLLKDMIPIVCQILPLERPGHVSKLYLIYIRYILVFASWQLGRTNLALKEQKQKKPLLG